MAQAKHTPMPAADQGNTVSRRSFLAAAPALAVAGAGPAPAATETPVMALFREWTALWAEGERLPCKAP